jgi:predicted RecB family nuclease
VYAHDGPNLKKILKEVVSIARGKEVPPIYDRGVPPFIHFTNDRARKDKDVTCIPLIKKSLQGRCIEAGYLTFTAVAKCRTPKELEAVKGIGPKKAPKIYNKARALTRNKHLLLERVPFPESRTEVFLDFEGIYTVPFKGVPLNYEFLIGALVRKDGREEYTPFHASNLIRLLAKHEPSRLGTSDDYTEFLLSLRQEERRIFTALFDWISKQDDPIIYHWSSHKKRRLHRFYEYHDRVLPDRYRKILIKMQSKSRDLQSHATRCFAFPTCDDRLKSIANYCGFEWQEADKGAMEWVALFLEALETGKKVKKVVKRITQYNRDDCTALRHIKDWVVNQMKT